MKSTPLNIQRLELQADVCYLCRQPLTIDDATIDHYNPLSKGAGNLNNRVLAHRKCNGFKSAMDIKKLNVTCFIIIQRELMLFRKKGYLDNIRRNKIVRAVRIYWSTKQMIQTGNTPVLF